MSKIKNAVPSANHAVIVTTKAGAPLDTDYDNAVPGTLMVNTATNKLYFRGTSAWVLVTSA
jgi:hypothetical protein